MRLSGTKQELFAASRIDGSPIRISCELQLKSVACSDCGSSESRRPIFGLAAPEVAPPHPRHGVAYGYGRWLTATTATIGCKSCQRQGGWEVSPTGGARAHDPRPSQLRASTTTRRGVDTGAWRVRCRSSSMSCPHLV